MERYWGPLLNGVRTRLSDSGLHSYLWPYAASFTNYIWNHVKVVHKDHGIFTPYELFTGNKSNLSLIKRWGCVAASHIPKSLRRKLETKAILGHFVGVDEISRSIYVYIPNERRIIKTGDFIFDEMRTNFKNPLLNIQSTTAEELKFLLPSLMTLEFHYIQLI